MNLGGTVHLNRMGVCIVFFCFLLIALYMTRGIDDSERKNLPSVNLRNLLLASIELAEKGGDQVVLIKNNANLKIRSKGKTKEGAESLVTAADYNSHCVMYFGLKKAFPRLQIISEEQVNEAKCGHLASAKLTRESMTELNLDRIRDEEIPEKDITIWIDPLDATQEYTEDLLEYVTTLVCVVNKGRPIIGVIHRPFAEKHKTSWAWVNEGMSPDLDSYKSVGGDLPVIVSRSHSGPIKDIVHKALGPDTKILEAGGAGYKVLQVVSGNASVYVHATEIKKWDICAGNAILTAVGGTMTTLTNEDIDYSPAAGNKNKNGILATIDNHLVYARKFHQALQKDLHL